MRRLRVHARTADVVHLQWLSVPDLDRFLLPKRPRAFTVHYPLPRSRRRARRQRALLERMDAVIAHSEHGAAELPGVAPRPRARAHGSPTAPSPTSRSSPTSDRCRPSSRAVEGPVILCFGLVRPYKGVDVLLEAFREIEGAELWVVGMPRMDMAPLRRLAEGCAGKVRFVERFITDPEIPAYFRRADVVVLPYREIEQSGVLYTALAFGNADRRQRRRRLRRGRRARRRAAAGAAAERPEPLAEALAELVADPRRPRRARRRRGPSGGGTVLVGGGRRAHARALPPPGSGDDRPMVIVEVVFWVAAGLLVYTHVGYPLVLALLARRRPRRRPPALPSCRRCR